MFDSHKVLQKEKNSKENDFIIFNYIMENSKENKS